MGYSTVAHQSPGDIFTAAQYNQFADNDEALKAFGIEFFIDGGGAAITTGIKGGLEIPCKADIDRVTLLADQTGSIKIDVWKDTYANYPPGTADSICGTVEPEIDSAIKYQDGSLSSWTTALAAGDVLYYNVDSCTTIEWCLISLKCSKS